jgi:hypothetical protein
MSFSPRVLSMDVHVDKEASVSEDDMEQDGERATQDVVEDVVATGAKPEDSEMEPIEDVHDISMVWSPQLEKQDCGKIVVLVFQMFVCNICVSLSILR